MLDKRLVGFLSHELECCMVGHMPVMLGIQAYMAYIRMVPNSWLLLSYGYGIFSCKQYGLGQIEWRFIIKKLTTMLYCGSIEMPLGCLPLPYLLYFSTNLITTVPRV